ncbi:MAG TPA: guanylate kinase [Ignavibacteriaceae bacterium]|nr:guanylate kinase [Ignavibacteriaceae bacterium]
MISPKGKIIVIAAPSGAGKTTLVRSALAEFPQIVFSISATTRKKRANEKDGIDYFFITEEEFLNKIEKKQFVEWEKFYDYYYGTYKYFIDDNINSGKNILLEIDVKGALSIKKIYPEAYLIYIAPPSKEELINRLKKRQTETDQDLKKRIERIELELSMKDKFDYILINNELNKATSEMKILINNLLTKGE